MKNKLTPKEQADNLYNKFLEKGHAGFEAIQCALICIEVIGQANLEKPADYLYWLEVRVELNKLWNQEQNES